MRKSGTPKMQQSETQADTYAKAKGVLSPLFMFLLKVNINEVIIFCFPPSLLTPKVIGQQLLEEEMNLRYRGRTQSDRRNLLSCSIETKLTPNFVCNGLCHLSKALNRFLFTLLLFCGEMYLSSLSRNQSSHLNQLYESVVPLRNKQYVEMSF